MTNTEFMRNYIIHKIYAALSIFNIEIIEVTITEHFNDCNITIRFRYGDEKIILTRTIRPEPIDEEINFIIKDICIYIMNGLYGEVTKWYTNATVH